MSQQSPKPNRTPSDAALDDDARLPMDSTAAWAAIAGALVGLTIIVLASLQITADSASSPVLVAAQFAFGGLELLCAYLMLYRRRAGWGFFLSLNGTLFVATFFGAPKIRDLADISIGLALVPAAVFFALAVFAALDHDQF